MWTATISRGHRNLKSEHLFTFYLNIQVCLSTQTPTLLVPNDSYWPSPIDQIGMWTATVSRSQPDQPKDNDKGKHREKTI